MKWTTSVCLRNVIVLFKLLWSWSDFDRNENGNWVQRVSSSGNFTYTWSNRLRVCEWSARKLASQSLPSRIPSIYCAYVQNQGTCGRRGWILTFAFGRYGSEIQSCSYKILIAGYMTPCNDNNFVGSPTWTNFCSDSVSSYEAHFIRALLTGGSRSYLLQFPWPSLELMDLRNNTALTSKEIFLSKNCYYWMIYEN